MTKELPLQQINIRYLCGDTIVIRCSEDYLQVFECLSKFQRKEGSYAIELLLYNTSPSFLCVCNASWQTATVTVLPWSEVGHRVHSSGSHGWCIVSTTDMIKTEMDRERYPGIRAHLEASLTDQYSTGNLQVCRLEIYTFNRPSLRLSAVSLSVCHHASIYELSQLRIILMLFSV